MSMIEPNDNEFADYFGDEAAIVLNRAVDSRMAAAGHRPPQQQHQQQPQQHQPPQHQGEAAADALLDCILDGDDAGARRISGEIQTKWEQSLTGERTGRIGMDERPRGVGMGS